jgi:hypothetical protein
MACDITKETMNAYCAEVCKLEDHFEGLEFHHVSCDNNVAADVLSKLGSQCMLVPAGVFVQDLRKPLIRLLMTEAANIWHLDFIAYIVEKRVKEDKVKREKIARHAANYIVIGTELYRRSASNSVLMKCILRT